MKIVVVEDEVRIREGLSKLLKKINPLYETVGEAGNGEEGLAVIREKQPDLIITDIRMPDMNGLEMLEKAREQGNFAKAIVLSAYSEFSYAQQAIRLGVSEYLLKPIHVSNLTQALKKIENALSKEQEDSAAQPDELRSLERIFYDLFTSEFTVTPAIEKYLSDTHGIETGGEFSVALIYLGSQYLALEEKTISRMNVYINRQDGGDFCILHCGNEKVIMVIHYNYPDGQALEHWFLRLLETQFTGPDCRCGWTQFHGLENFKKNATGLLNAMDYAISLDERLICYPQVAKLKLSPLVYPADIEKKMRDAFCMQNFGALEKIASDFFDYFKKGEAYPPKEIKQVFTRFLWSGIHVMKEINYVEYKKLNQQDLLLQITDAITFQELELPIRELFQKSRIQKEDFAGNLTIQKALNIIHEFYGQGITLEEVAKKLNITPQYLSTQFKKETGKNFNSYMKEYRMKKAKELLLSTDMKLYEICQRVGYSDAKYFSNVFREYAGVLPAEYRKNMK